MEIHVHVDPTASKLPDKLDNLLLPGSRATIVPPRRNMGPREERCRNVWVVAVWAHKVARASGLRDLAEGVARSEFVARDRGRGFVESAPRLP